MTHFGVGTVSPSDVAIRLVRLALVTPGVPRSRLRGGAWDDVTVVSKSGAFGPDALWRDLLAGNGHSFGSIDA